MPVQPKETPFFLACSTISEDGFSFENHFSMNTALPATDMIYSRLFAHGDFEIK